MKKKVDITKYKSYSKLCSKYPELVSYYTSGQLEDAISDKDGQIYLSPEDVKKFQTDVKKNHQIRYEPAATKKEPDRTRLVWEYTDSGDRFEQKL